MTQKATAGYVEKPELFDDEDFVMSSLCPGKWFNCVEVAHKDGTIAVRNSYDDQKRAIYFDAEEWRKFVTGVKNGDFGIV